ncbi:MAG TPA: hypothetical protein ENH94_09035 [Phycisphaerales bacterium]|nr:hypothetical protein [Phycisphaerales bacterium]
MDNNLSRKNNYEKLDPSDIPPDYYDFSFYVSKERMITYWHQANEILTRKPEKLLEIGIGNRIVSSILKCYGVETCTADINESLGPDVVVPISELQSKFSQGQYPFVLCARVLQHLPFADFENSISQLHHVTNNYLLLTLPVETLRVYIRFRITGKNPRTFSIPFPISLKKILQRLSLKHSENGKTQNFWKINQTPEVSMANIKKCLEKHFIIEKSYQVPEDMSHAFFILKKKNNS